MDLSESSRFGRGNGHVKFQGEVVVKTTSESFEPVFMGMFGLAHAEILHCKTLPGDQVQFTMPRYIWPDLERDGESVICDGLNTLGKCLWGEEPPFERQNPNWRDALTEHLLERITTQGLELSKDKVQRFIGDLPEESERRHTIHGDATLANMVYDPVRGWIWVDPLVKPYVPWDRIVDLGKAFQTCWGYERVILGMQQFPELNERLAMDVVRRANVPYVDVMRWCIVHVMRLLPYQEPVIRDKFTHVVLHDFADLG